jgi:hypothetical protein
MLSGTLFGGLHCLAWKFQYPTSGEQLAWRICSLFTTCLPILSIPIIAIWMYMNPYNGSRPANAGIGWVILDWLCFIALLAYKLARLFLIIEIFRSLFYLPPEAFLETWSGNFPHFGWLTPGNRMPWTKGLKTCWEGQKTTSLNGGAVPFHMF